MSQIQEIPMSKIELAEEVHTVNILPPVDITGGAAGDVFTMKNHQHASIVVQVGASAAAFTKILVNACSDFAGSNAEAIPYRLRSEETAAGDTLGAKEDVAATGKTPAAADNIFYVIDIDGDELPDGKPFVQLSLTNGVNSVIASAVAILSGSRYAADQNPTVIA
jgi:hypothetical protein